MINKEEIENLKHEIDLKNIKIYELNREIEQLKENEKEHQKINGELRQRIKELEEIKKEFDRRSNLSNAQLLKRGYISKDKIREIVELYDNSKKELVILPNKEVCCLSDCVELIEYLRKLLKEAEDKR